MRARKAVSGEFTAFPLRHRAFDLDGAERRVGTLDRCRRWLYLLGQPGRHDFRPLVRRALLGHPTRAHSGRAPSIARPPWQDDMETTMNRGDFIDGMLVRLKSTGQVMTLGGTEDDWICTTSDN